MAEHDIRSMIVMKSTLSRMPLYYTFLCSLQKQKVLYVSSAMMAQGLNMNPVLVRKDLACLSGISGMPRVGFEVDSLLKALEDYLGYNNTDQAILVGVGSLGRLILTNKEFDTLGMHIAVGFDKDPHLAGLQVESKYILPMEKMESYVKRTGIRIGIITVPADQAQNVCDQMVRCGIKAIWNFAFTLLNVPPTVLVKNENLPMSLALLSHQLEKNDGKR